MQQGQQGRTASGFTLIEMLVVIGIIGVLMALLLPAVQSARDAARRSSCINNLRQIGIAVDLYHNAHNSYPPGAINPGPCCSTLSFTTWTIAILPQLELKNLYDQYDQSLSNEENARLRTADRVDPRPLVQKFVAVYSCPADVYRKTLGRPDTGPARDLNLLYMPGSYRGVGGRGDPGPHGSRWWDNTAKGSVKAGSWPWPQKKWRGVFHMVDSTLRTEKQATVKDGLSNTLLVGEYCTRSNLSRRTFWAYAYGSYNRSDAVPQSRTLIGDWDRCSQTHGVGEFEPCNRGWGSFHQGVVNFLLCDGHVRSLSLTIDTGIFAEAATIAGGEFAPLP